MSRCENSRGRSSGAARLLCAAALLATGTAMPVHADDPFGVEELADLPIEELLRLNITSVQGTPTEWFRSPAAVYVITHDELRRSGARSLADALRLAPGVFVGQASSHTFSIGMRGFNGSLSAKTLVLIDGRSVYDPLIGGTYWNVQDVLLEDVDRIEVIRGPGPTLWGENAVNGVINVITRSVRDTVGTYFSAGAGTYERGFAEARYGAAISDNAWFRVYGKWFERDHLETSAGASTHDDWAMGRGGFRLDTEGDDGFTFTLQGDIYHSDRIGEAFFNVPLPDQHMVFMNDIRDSRNSGGNMLFRLAQRIDEDRSWSLQGYYDRTERTTNAGFRVHRDTFDLEFRHQFPIGDQHDILWGLEARNSSDRTHAGPNTFFTPASETLERYSAFVQDTITLVPDRWFAMIGSKFTYDTFGDVQLQPSARVWWTPNDRHTLWAAISRPVRVPSRIEHDGNIVIFYADTGLLGGGPPSGVIEPTSIAGSPAIKPETLLAYEAGYRVRVTDDITLDAAVFYNDYDRLIYLPPTVIGAFNNAGFAETYGGEISGLWTLSESCRLRGSYSYVDVQVHGPIFGLDEFNTPQHQAQLRCELDLTRDLELNTAIYYVDNVRAARENSYERLDLGVTWHVNENVDLSVWGLNLLDRAHREFTTSEIERSVFVQASFRF